MCIHMYASNYNNCCTLIGKATAFFITRFLCSQHKDIIVAITYTTAI